MPFQRDWRGFPRIWDQWTEEADGGSVWTIKDLPPEDDAMAVDLIIKYFLKDELLCKETGVKDDPGSLRGCRQFWSQGVFPQRVSLACYRQQGTGQAQLVALNGLVVKSAGDEKDLKIEGEPARQVLSIMAFMESQKDVFKTLCVDKYLSGAGLVVSRECRGFGLGAKLLNCREALCRHLGIKATATVFSGPYSQNSAASCGFETILAYTLRELNDLGFQYPRDDRPLKLMAKIYQH